MPDYRCRFCRESFAWETAQYSLIWSRILIHLGECEAASSLSRDERSIEARRVAGGILGLIPQRVAAKQVAVAADQHKHKRR